MSSPNPHSSSDDDDDDDDGIRCEELGYR
jgi:hypothetical protein